MQQSEIKNIASEVYRLTETKLFALAFRCLRILLKQLQEWWAISRCEELEGVCAQMLRYSLGDYEDPQRDVIISKLQHDIYLLTDDIVEAIATKNFAGYDYEQKRIYVKNQEQGLLLDFRSIWLNSRLSSEDVKLIIAFIANKEVDLTSRQMAVSALLLKMLRSYDVSVLMIYLELLADVDSLIKARIMVGLVMILAVHNSRIAKEVEQRNKIVALFAEQQFVTDVEKVYKHIINTFGTDKVTRKITTEIYPEIFRSGAKIQKMIKDENVDISEDEINPKWEKAFLDDEGVSAKLREFGDMQMQGADVYMSTFSSMKGYPFFNDIANWFMPFDEKQADVARLMADMPDVLRFFSESTHMCSSDKYSFFYSIAQIPATSFKSMMSGMRADADAVHDELDSENWKNNPEKVYAIEVRSYVLDLFRFYRLHPRRKDFVNPFEQIVNFESNELLSECMPIGLCKSICKYLFEVERFVEALHLFEYLDAQQVWDAYFYQQMGYCYQQLERWADAVACYEKADLLESNDAWTLKHKALCYRKLERQDEAAECYDAILKLKDDDVATMINLANYYLYKSDFVQARSVFYKVEYLKPNNYKAMSGLAWCLFMEGDYEKAMTYYDRLAHHKDFMAEDALNAGHTFWVLGAKDIAREYYCKAKTLIDNDVVFAEKMISDAEHLRKLGLSDEDIVILINQILF